MKNNINKIEVDFDIIDEEEIVETFNHAALPVVSKEREKAEKIALKAVKNAKKDAEKVEKLALKAVEKVRKNAEKAEKIEKEKLRKNGIKEGKELQKRIYKKKMEKEEGKFEIKRDAFMKIFKVAEQLDIENPDQGYTINNTLNFTDI